MFFRFNYLQFIIALLVLTLPRISFADLEITEIMYDISGSDTKREWVEIYNSGDSPIDVGEWHFWENDVHHGIDPIDFTTLGPGEYAILVQDFGFSPEGFDSGKRIKSSFSLSNQGETLGLSDSAKNIVFSYLYGPRESADGNGASIQIINGSWQPSVPTPGKTNAFSQVDISDTSAERVQNSSIKKVSSAKKSSARTKKVDYDELDLDIEGNFLAGEELLFDISRTHYKGSRSTISPYGFYYISFGDGSHFAGEKDKVLKKGIKHRYDYPGEYMVIIYYFKSHLAYKDNQDPDAEYSLWVEVQDLSISIDEIDQAANIHITNSTSMDINLEGWSLATAGKEFFRIPDQTWVRAGKTLVLSSRIHGIHFFDKGQNIVLRNTREYTVDNYKHGVVSTPIVLPVISKKHQNKALGTQTDLTLGENVSVLDGTDYYLQKNPEKQKVSFADHEYLPENSQNDSTDFSNAALVLLGATSVGLVALRKSAQKKPNQEDRDLDNGDDVIGEIELMK